MVSSISSLGAVLNQVGDYTYIENPVTRVAWSAFCCLAALYTQPVLKVLCLVCAALVWVSPTEAKTPPETPSSHSGSDADNEGDVMPLRPAKKRSWAEVTRDGVVGGYGPQPGKQ